MNNKSIVIVEDDPQLLEELTAAFSGAGFTVDLASDGAEAVRVGLADKPDAVLLDLILYLRNMFTKCCGK